MESLYLLIPLSVLLVLGIGGLLVWTVMSGQLDELEREGERVLDQSADTSADSAPAQDSGSTGAQERSSCSERTES